MKAEDVYWDATFKSGATVSHREHILRYLPTKDGIATITVRLGTVRVSVDYETGIVYLNGYAKMTLPIDHFSSFEPHAFVHKKVMLNIGTGVNIEGEFMYAGLGIKGTSKVTNEPIVRFLAIYPNGTINTMTVSEES